MERTMNEVYIAFFDCLGFKEFIFNNSDDDIINGMGNVFRDIELALGQGKMQEPRGGVILSDISGSGINSLNISDTILFWTNNDSQSSLIEIMKVAHEFNWRMIKFNFPVRGCVLKGKAEFADWSQNNNAGGKYNLSCLYGKGVVDSYVKAEAQDWAGSVIDSTIINDIETFEEGKQLLEEKCFLYKVPYKNGLFPEIEEEYVFKLEDSPLNETAFANVSKDIINGFRRHNKPINESVQRKIDNTLKFLKQFKE